MIFGFPQPWSCSWVMVEKGLVDTNTYSLSHTHIRALWSRQVQTTGTHVEQVSEQTFIPALSCSMSKLLPSNFSCIFTHLVFCALPAISPLNTIQYTERVLLSWFRPVCMLTLLPAGFLLSALWPQSELSQVGLLPSEGHSAHLALRYLSWRGYLVCAGINRYFPFLAWQACAKVHKDLLTVYTLLEAKAPGNLCVVMSACIRGFLS